MRGPLAVLLAVLLAFAAVGVPAAPPNRSASHPSTAESVPAPGQPRTPAPTPNGGQTTPTPSPGPVVSVPNTTNYLALPPDDIQTQGFGTVTLEVSSALAAESGRLDAAFSRHQLRAAYAGAETDAERSIVLRRARNRVAPSVDDLESRERRALAAYNAGDLSAKEFLRTLAVIDARADELQRVVRELEGLSGGGSNSPVTETDIARYNSGLISLQGPVRNRVGQVIAGERQQSQRVYVETSSNGIVLAMVAETNTGMQYVREAYVGRNRQPGANDRFDGDFYAVERRFRNIYQWSFALGNFQGSSTKDTGLRYVGVYRTTINHDHGQLEAFLDGGTNTTFKEYQRKKLSAVPTGPAVTNTSDGLRLQVHRTRAGGPLEVRVVDDATGTPVDARIAIEGTVIGRTGTDGHRWTIGPANRFTVTATTAEGNVSVDTAYERTTGE